MTLQLPLTGHARKTGCVSGLGARSCAIEADAPESTAKAVQMNTQRRGAARMAKKLKLLVPAPNIG